MNFFHQSNPPADADQDMSQQPSVVPVYVSNSQHPHFHQQQSLRAPSQDAFSQLQIPLQQHNPPQSAPQNLDSPPINSFDLGDLSVPELLNAINPDLIEYFQSNTPQVLSALMEQDNRNHHLPQNTAPLSTQQQQVLITDDNNSNVSSYLSEIASSPHSVSSPESVPRSNIVPYTSAPQLTTHSMPAALNRNPPGNSARPANPSPVGAAAAVAAAAAAASAAASAAAARHTLSQQPQRPVMQNVRRNHPMVSVQHPHANPNHPQLHLAARHPQFSPSRPGITLDQQAALNSAAAAAARARANPSSAHLNSKQLQRMPHNANPMAARQAMQSRHHSASARPQLSAHQPRMTPASSAPIQNPVATMSTPVLNSTMTPSPPKTKPADRRSKSRTRDPQRATVKREDTGQSPSSSLKRPAPSSRSDASASASPSNVPPAVMSASQLQQMPVKMEDPSIDDIETGEEDVESKKAMRAERNRQSAAASRERRKHHIKELERRVKQLSQENAALQVEQLSTIKERIEKEKKLVKENTQLKEQVVFKNMEISKLSHELAKVRVRLPSEDPLLKRPSTWDSAEWKGKLKITT